MAIEIESRRESSVPVRRLFECLFGVKADVPTEDDQIRELEGKELRLRLEEVELVDCDGESSKLEVMMKFRN